MMYLTSDLKVNRGAILVLLNNGTGNLDGIQAGNIFMYTGRDSDHKFCEVKDLERNTRHKGLLFKDVDNNPRFRLAYKNEAKEHRGLTNL